MKYITFLFIAIVSLTSCEKVIDLDLSNNENKIVIEGNITNQAGPYFVKITQSVNFNAPNDFPAVNNAIVSISDNTGAIDNLVSIGNGLYRTSTLQGVTGRTYNLSVTIAGKNYTAQSTMPQLVNFDSIRLSRNIANDKEEITAIPRYTDPIQIGNGYRFKQTINGKLDPTYFVFNDNLNNGLVNQRPLRSGDPDVEILIGDRVTIEMQCLSKSAYDFFYSLSQQSGNGPGGGTAPANPVNNISGNALGIFSAHTIQTRTIIVP